MTDSPPSGLEELSVPEQISRLVKAQLALAGYKQQDAERELGLSRPAASRRWVGAMRFRGHELTALAKWLGIDRDLLVPESLRPEGGWTYWQAAEIFED